MTRRRSCTPCCCAASCSPAREGTLDFVHRTFQDYLGARYAVEEGHLDVIAGRADDTQWEDVIRMAVAHARPGGVRCCCAGCWRRTLRV